MAKIVRDTGSGMVYDWDDEKSLRKWIDFCWEEFKNDELRDNMSDISMISADAATLSIR